MYFSSTHRGEGSGNRGAESLARRSTADLQSRREYDDVPDYIPHLPIRNLGSISSSDRQLPPPP